MKTAPLTADPTDPTTAPPSVRKPVRAGHETASEFFGRVLTERGVPEDGSVAISVSIHARNANGQPAARLGDPVPWSEFDDGDFGRPPGTYVLTLKTGGNRYPLAQCEYVVGSKPVLTPAALPPVPPAAAPPAGATGNAPGFDSNAIFGLILQQNQAAMAQQQSLTNTLLQVALTPQQPRNVFEDMLKIDELLDSRANRVSGGGSMIADAIRDSVRELVPVALELIKRPAPAPQGRPTAPQRPALPARPPSLPAASPAATQEPSPPAAGGDPVPPEQALFASLDQLAPMLKLGAQNDGDPALYADLLIDAMVAHDFDITPTLAAFEPGHLAAFLAERYQLDVAWVRSVEDELRAGDAAPTDAGVDALDRDLKDLVGDDRIDPPFEPTEPAAVEPPAKPAKGRKKTA